MKQTLVALTCLSAFSLAALAADDEKAKPDNTATNERDRSGETKTSGDQSNSPVSLFLPIRARARDSCDEITYAQGQRCQQSE